MNKTRCIEYVGGAFDCWPSANVPFYYSLKPALVDGFPDHYLALAAPIGAYWSLSLFFHYLDISGWKWLDKYRIHESAEVKSRNLASRSQVVWAVLLQQVIQTMLGLVWMDDAAKDLVNHGERMMRIGSIVQPALQYLAGGELSRTLLPEVVYCIYWWLIPTFQFFFAMCVFLPFVAMWA